LKDQLTKIYVNSLIGNANDPSEYPNLLGTQYVVSTKNGLTLTKQGRNQFKVVFTGGTYDLLHTGHLRTLEEAKSLGDVLVVVIARDATASKRKRVPFQNENERLKLVDSLGIVDVAILGDEVDHLKSVERVKPDIIAIGADQNYDEQKLLRTIHQRGLSNVEIQRLNSDYEGLSTTKLIKKIVERYCKIEEV